MKRFYTLTAIAGLMIFQSCTKNSTDDTGGDQGPQTVTDPFANCRVTEIARHNFATNYLEYDAQRRLVRYHYDDYDRKFTYSGNTIDIDSRHKGDPFMKYKITVNQNGLAAKVRSEPQTNAYWREDVYEYDGTRVVKRTETGHNITSPRVYVYQWLDGNMVAEVAPGNKITKYTYDTNEAAQPADYLRLDTHNGYIIVKNKNRVKSITNQNGDTFTASYSEDANGLIKSVTVKTPSNTTYTENYKYNCN